jgi:putative DNA primase/helicase
LPRLADHGLVRPGVVAEATAEYFDDQDTLGQWLEDHCVRDKREFEAQVKLYQSWKVFADRQGDRAGSSKAFSANLIRRGFKADRTRIGGIVTQACRLPPRRRRR